MLVYQMGKTGSLAVCDALREAGLPAVYHVHNLRPGVADPRYRLLRRAFVEEGRAADIVTLVREPIGRDISAFFENFERVCGRPLDPGLGVAELTQLFLDLQPHDAGLRWFDRQLKEVLGIDVFATPFDPGAGSVVVETPRHRALILRSEMSDADKQERLARFLGLPRVELGRGHATEAKERGGRYREFVAQAVLPDAYIRKMLDAPVARHFYAAAEIESLRSHWLRAPRDPAGPLSA